MDRHGRQRGDQPAVNFYRLKNSGFITMRSGWEPDDDYLYFMTGPMGSGVTTPMRTSSASRCSVNGFPLLTSAGKDNYDKSPCAGIAPIPAEATAPWLTVMDRPAGPRRPWPCCANRRTSAYYQSANGDITYAASKFNGPYGSAGYGDQLEKAGA